MFGYKPKGMEMWDTWYIEDKGKAHVFYLQFILDDKGKRVEINHLGHALSENLIQWEEQIPALCAGEPGSLDDMQPWTGCITFNNGRYFLYYTMRSTIDGSKGQHIGLAVSDDLYKFTRYRNNPVISPDPKWYVSHQHKLPNGVVDCRDLMVVKSSDEDVWYGFYAARIEAEEMAEGAVIAAAKSNDLVNWEHLPPAFIPRKYACVEVPDVFSINGKWYMICLTGHGYGNRGVYGQPNITQGTIYAVADKIEGPYQEQDDFLLLAGDSSCGYSCRSLLFKGDRYVFYTERITNTISPPMRVFVNEKGYLRLGFSEWTKKYRKSTLLEPGVIVPFKSFPYCHTLWKLPGGKWDIKHNKYIGSAKFGWQSVDLGVGSADVEIEAKIKILKGAAAGIIWRSNSSSESCWSDVAFIIDTQDQMVRAGFLPLFTEQWYRKIDLNVAGYYHLRICIRRPRVELYLDDTLMLQFAIKSDEVICPSVGLIVDRAETEIYDLGIYELENVVY